MGRHLLAPSILSADFTCLGEQIQQAEKAGAAWIHVDVMDGHFVPNLSIGPAVVEACRRVTRLPLDVHLMVEKPERFIESFAQAGADHLTVHVESTYHLHRVLHSIRDMGLKAGVTLNPATPLEAIAPVLPMVDLVLVMCVNPGFSGQGFIEAMLPKIRRLRDWLDRGDGQALIEVDGGISPSTIPELARAGADVFVAATAVFGHPQGIAAGLDSLRQALAASVP
jgi:ribulose-phosphate 3-epimerase